MPINATVPALYSWQTVSTPSSFFIPVKIKLECYRLKAGFYQTGQLALKNARYKTDFARAASGKSKIKGMQIRILTAAEVRRALPMADAIEGMKDAYAQLSAGSAHVPLRLRVSVPTPPGVSLIMPAFMQGTGDLAVKVVSVFNDNPAREIGRAHV